MELIGYYYSDEKQEAIYLVKNTSRKFFYITNKSQSIIYDWFVIEKAVVEYCKNNFHNFQLLETKY